MPENPSTPSRADAVASLRTQISSDLLSAMKERNQAAIITLRCFLAVLDNAGAQDPKAFGSLTEVPRRSLAKTEVQALIQAEINSRRSAIIDYERGARHQDAARLRAEVALLSRYAVS